MIMFLFGLFILTIFAYLFSFFSADAKDKAGKRPEDPKAKFLIPNDGGALKKFCDAEG